MTLQSRILLAQLPALTVVLVLLLWGGFTVDHLGAASQRILADNYRSVLAAQRMKESIERLDSAALFEVTGESERAAALRTVNLPIFESELVVEEGNLTEPGEPEITASLRKRWVAYQERYEVFLAAPAAEQRAIYFSDLLPAFLRVKDDADRVLALNQDAMAQRSDAAEGSADRARRAWLGWSILGVLGAVSLGTLVSKRISSPLKTLAQSAVQVGEGQLDVRLPDTGIVELDQLAGAFNQMAERLRQYRRVNNTEISRAREAAQAAIESLVDPVLVLNLQGDVRASNTAARRLFGPDHRGVVTPGTEVASAVRAACDAVLASGLPVIPTDFSSVVLVATPEAPRALLPHASPVNDAVTGELVGVTLLLQDVTRLRRLDELKGNLVQTAAHELRTPLTSLGMALHLALDERVSGPISERQAELLSAAREDVTRLKDLVEDLLDLSRVQQGSVRLQREAVSPAALLTAVCQGMKHQATEANVAVTVEPGLEETAISADRARLGIALANLISNALRYAPAGSTIRTRAVPTPVGVRFEVDDEGPGVSPEERERIFEPFVRGDHERGLGAGLGLTIAREVATAHDGRVGVGEAPGGGARFWVEVPSGEVGTGASGG